MYKELSRTCTAIVLLINSFVLPFPLPSWLSEVSLKVKFATTSMTSTSTVNICLRVLELKNKNSSQSYSISFEKCHYLTVSEA